MITFVLILLIVILVIKILSNKDIIKENSKNETDIANVKYAKKYYRKTKTATITLLVSIFILIMLLICDFTDFDKYIIDYFSTEFYVEQEFNRTLYFIPIYIYIARCIIIEVNIGDYLYKYFKVEEPQLEENLLKSILYKKPKQVTPQENNNNNNENNKETEIPKENLE